jgi:hypothetical protein
MASTRKPKKNASEAATEPVVSTPAASSELIQPVSPGTSRKKLILFGLIGVLIGLGIAGSAFVYYVNSHPKTPVIAQIAYPTQPSPSPTPDPTADWREVTMANWHLKIPADWHYLACDENVQYFGKEFQKDEDNPDCGFDGFPGSLLILKDNKAEEILIPVSNQDVTVTNKVSTKVDGLDAIKLQEEMHADGPGAGTYLHVYVPSKKITISFDDENEPEIFDQILSTIRLTK